MGATLYHLVATKPPDALARADEVLRGNPDPLRPISHFNSQVPPAVDNLIMQALKLNPNQRPQSAQEMRHALRRATPAGMLVTQSVVLPAPSPPIPQPRPQPVVRTRQATPWPMPALVGAVVLAALLLFVVISMFGGREPDVVTVKETVVVQVTPAEPEVVTQVVEVEKEVEVEKVVTEVVEVEKEVEVEKVVTEVVEVEKEVEVEVTVVVSTTATPAPQATEPPQATEQPPSETPSLGDIRTRAQDGMTMLYVPAGTFQMGSDDSDSQAESDEKPAHPVTLSAFWIDQTEVTNEQFAAFLNERGNQEEDGVTWLEVGNSNTLIEQQGDSFQPKEGFANHPVIELSWYGAKAYCEWAGGRLPTEAEWEYAARGPEGRIYPWGNEFDGSRANCSNSFCSDGFEKTAPVGTFPAGASWVGALDMAGNVWEWTNDRYNSEYYKTSPEENPDGPGSGGTRVLRGGGWNLNKARTLSGAYRINVSPPFRYGYIGFRCVESPG